MSDTDTTRAVVAQVYQAGTSGDLETFVSCLHPEFELFEPSYLPYGGVYTGIDGFQQAFAAASAMIDFDSLTLQSLIADGDQAVGILNARLRSGGAELTLSELWRVRDGKIVSCRVFIFDPTEIPQA